MTFARKLLIQFTKARRKGHARNAELDPKAPELVVHCLEPQEPVLVKVNARSGNCYWFTDRRLLLQTGESVYPLFRYDDVEKVHWISKEPFAFVNLDTPVWQKEVGNIKSRHYDRLVVSGVREVVLEGLGQAYVPTLSFLQWISSS